MVNGAFNCILQLAKTALYLYGNVVICITEKCITLKAGKSIENGFIKVYCKNLCPIGYLSFIFI